MKIKKIRDWAYDEVIESDKIEVESYQELVQDNDGVLVRAETNDYEGHKMIKDWAHDIKGVDNEGFLVTIRTAKREQWCRKVSICANGV